MKNTPRNTSHIRKTIVLILLAGSVLGSTAQSCQTTTNSPYWGAINELWNLPTGPDFIQDLADSINPDGTLVLNQAAALIKQFPSGDIIADILSIDAALLPAVAIPGSSTTGAVPARQGFLDVDLAAANALILPAVAIPASTTTAFVPGRTGVLGTDIGLADALILGLTATGISPARTNIIGVDAGLVDALLLPLNPVLASATTAAVPARLGVIGPDINQLKSYLGVGGTTTLGEDMGIIDAKILNPATGNIIADINTVDASIATPATGVLSTSVQVVKTILGVGGATSLSADALTIDSLILPDVAIPPIPFVTQGATANTNNIFADIATILNGPFGTTTLGVGVVGSTPLGASIGILDNRILGSAATGNLYNDINSADALLLPAVTIPVGTLNGSAAPPKLTATVPARTGIISNDIALLDGMLGVPGLTLTLGEEIGILDYRVYGSLATNLYDDLENIINNPAPTTNTTTIGYTAAVLPSLRQILGFVDNLILDGARTGNIIADIATLGARITTPSTGILSTDVQTVKTALGVGGTTSLQADVAILANQVLDIPTGNLNADLATLKSGFGVGGLTLEGDLNALDEKLVVGPTGNLNTDINTVSNKLGVGGTSLEGDVNFLDDFVTDGFPTGNLYNDIIALKNSISSDLTAIDDRILPSNAIPTQVGTYAVAANTGQGAATAGDVITDIATLLNAPLNTTASLGVITGDGTLGESIGVLDYKIHAQTGTGSLFVDIDAVKALIGVNGNSLFDDATAIDNRIAPAIAIPFSAAGNGTSGSQANTGNINTDITTILNGVLGTTTLGVPASTSIGQSLGVLTYRLVGVNSNKNLYSDMGTYSNWLVNIPTNNLADNLAVLSQTLGTYSNHGNTLNGPSQQSRAQTDLLQPIISATLVSHPGAYTDLRDAINYLTNRYVTVYSGD